MKKILLISTAIGGLSIYLLHKFYSKKLFNIKKQLYEKY